MKPEIIVTKIEEYINSLPKENRGAYDGVMAIKAKHPEESVKTFANALYDPILNLAVIIDELRQEIRESAIKQKSGSSTLQRIKKLNSFLNSELLDIRPQFKSAWIKNDQMCATNGYVGFIFNQKLDGVNVREEQVGDLVLEDCFPKDSALSETDVDIADVKAQLKLHRAKETGLKKKQKTDCLYVLDGHYYNAVYLIEAFEILGGNIIFYQTTNKLSAAVLKSENGKAVILPVRS